MWEDFAPAEAFDEEAAVVLFEPGHKLFTACGRESALPLAVHEQGGDVSRQVLGDD